MKTVTPQNKEYSDLERSLPKDVIPELNRHGGAWYTIYVVYELRYNHFQSLKYLNLFRLRVIHGDYWGEGMAACVILCSMHEMCSARRLGMKLLLGNSPSSPILATANISRHCPEFSVTACMLVEFNVKVCQID